jgi:hypothetical protein
MGISDCGFRIDEMNGVDFIFLTTDFSQNYTEHFDEWILFFQGQCRTRMNTDEHGLRRKFISPAARKTYCKQAPSYFRI